MQVRSGWSYVGATFRHGWQGLTADAVTPPPHHTLDVTESFVQGFRSVVRGTHTSASCTCSAGLYRTTHTWIMFESSLTMSDPNGLAVLPQVLPCVPAACRLLRVSACGAAVQQGVLLQPEPRQAPAPGRTGPGVPLWGRYRHQTLC